jgi:hypothetical protein
MVKTMPGRTTPDFKGSSGRVTFSLAMIVPSQAIELTRSVDNATYKLIPSLPAYVVGRLKRPKVSSGRQLYVLLEKIRPSSTPTVGTCRIDARWVDLREMEVRASRTPRGDQNFQLR